MMITLFKSFRVSLAFFATWIINQKEYGSGFLAICDYELMQYSGTRPSMDTVSSPRHRAQARANSCSWRRDSRRPPPRQKVDYEEEVPLFASHPPFFSLLPSFSSFFLKLYFVFPIFLVGKGAIRTTFFDQNFLREIWSPPPILISSLAQVWAATPRRTATAVYTRRTADSCRWAPVIAASAPPLSAWMMRSRTPPPPPGTWMKQFHVNIQKKVLENLNYTSPSTLYNLFLTEKNGRMRKIFLSSRGVHWFNVLV